MYHSTTEDEADIILKNWPRADWLERIHNLTGMEPAQIKNKAARMGLRRHRDKVYKKLKKEPYADPRPVPECLFQGRCPHGGMVWVERVPFTQYFNAVCIHGGRWEV